MGIVLLRNDLEKGGIFLELKVDIRVCFDFKVLIKYIILIVLNVKFSD